MWWFIAAGIGIIAIIIAVIKTNKSSIKKELTTWQVDDFIIIGNSYRKENMILEKHNKDYARLLGWTYDDVFLNLGDNITRKYDRGIVSCNKSAFWRDNFEKAKAFMNKEPGFNAGLNDNTNISSELDKDFLDGKDIDILSEVECEVYLKKALKEENYILVSKIKKRMEYFR